MKLATASPQWERFATPAFMEGRMKLNLTADAVPSVVPAAAQNVNCQHAQGNHFCSLADVPYRSLGGRAIGSPG
jgi:hypothetical protein